MYKLKRIITYIVFIIILIGIGLLLYYNRIKLSRILSPFVIALIIAYLLHPLVLRMERKRIKRNVAIIILYMLFTVAFVSIIVFVFPTTVQNTKELIVTIPVIANDYKEYFSNFLMTIKSSTLPEEIKGTIMRELVSGTELLQNTAVNTLKKALGSAVDFAFKFFDIVMSLIIAYYYIKDAELLKEGFLSLTPRKWRNFLISTGREISLILANFIQGQLLTALIVGALESIGLILIHAKYPVVLGMIGGIFNIIPFFGPFLGAIPAVAVSLIESPMKALWTALVFTIIQQIDNSLISPKIIEGRLGLHPVTTILAVLVGGEFMGILGMLIAVPIAAIIKIIVNRTIDLIV